MVFAPLPGLNPARGRCAQDRTGQSWGPYRLGSICRLSRRSDGFDRAAALGPAQLRRVPFEGGYQVLGVHAAPSVAVYRANDMAPWGHACASSGLTEPIKIGTSDVAHLSRFHLFSKSIGSRFELASSRPTSRENSKLPIMPSSIESFMILRTSASLSDAEL